MEAEAAVVFVLKLGGKGDLGQRRQRSLDLIFRDPEGLEEPGHHCCYNGVSSVGGAVNWFLCVV